MKTYTAQSGYVYQYYFVGKRDALPGDPEAPATEYVFDATADRCEYSAISVLLRADALAAWKAEHGRALNDAEQYAAAKMRLFQGFDELEKPVVEHRRLPIIPEQIEELLSGLEL